MKIFFPLRISSRYIEEKRMMRRFSLCLLWKDIDRRSSLIIWFRTTNVCFSLWMSSIICCPHLSFVPTVVSGWLAGWSLWWKTLEGTVRHSLFWLLYAHTVHLFSYINLIMLWLVPLLSLCSFLPIYIFFVPLPSSPFNDDSSSLRPLLRVPYMHRALIYAMVGQLDIHVLSLWSLFFLHRYLLELIQSDEYRYWFFFFFFFVVFPLRLADRNGVSRVLVNSRLIIIIKTSFYVSLSPFLGVI